jgi:methionyl aminopeptidase
VELDLPKAPSAFCSQACFKEAWATHKAAHRPNTESWAYVTDRGAGRSFKLPAFTWTGGLRPWRVGPRRAVPAHIPRPDYAETGIPASELASRQQRSVAVRTPNEVEGIRAACRLAREILDAAGAAVRPGVATDEIDRIVHEATVEAGAYPSPLNYFNFPKSVCTSVNEVVCHGIPDSRELADGDIVNIDVTAFYKGYHGDLNETYTVGSVDASSKKLIRVTAEALDKAIAAVKPGVRYRDVGDIITSHVRANELSFVAFAVLVVVGWAWQGKGGRGRGCCSTPTHEVKRGVSHSTHLPFMFQKKKKNSFNVVRTYCGHGIGDLFHCAPNIPHYAGNKAVGAMKAGQVFTIEPMVNAGSWRDTTWPDGWTAVTTDGARSAQFEHTLLVTDDGCEVLTARLPTSPPLCF